MKNKSLLEKTQHERNQLIKIIDNSTDGLLVFEDGKLIYVSPKLSEITEYTVPEIEANETGDFLIANDEERENMKRIAAERERLRKKKSTYLSKLKTKSGNIVPVEVTTTTFKQGGKTLMNVSFRDISRVNEAIEQLENMYSNQGKFFSEIAHSLKTPFTVIYGLLELYEHGDEKSREESVQEIRKELDLVNKKVSDLLKVAKMEMLDYPLKMQVIPLNEFLEAFYVKAKSLGYKYCDKSHNHNCPCFTYSRMQEKTIIKADNEVLMDVLMTLAENSYVHSPRKGQKPAISLKTIITKKQVKIVLEDRGKGISRTQLKKLFTPFAKKLFKPTGHGIGLPMCKKMIGKMNGDIIVKSKVGQGTKFIISFPIN
ncbi:PAS domain S-box protein [Candidatus Dojkabacteria bacterium]|nr:PAS domain S-box protein [Candidatus Dojkabacteria bacterium]